MSDTPTPDDLAALVATLRADVAYMRSEDGAPCCVSAEDADDYERAADALGALAARIEQLEAENEALGGRYGLSWKEVKSDTMSADDIAALADRLLGRSGRGG